MPDRKENLERGQLKEKITYCWKNPENGRHYNATLTQDLLGDWVIVKSWGGSKAGRVQYCYYPSYEKGIRELHNVTKTRGKRGYKRV